MAFKSLSKTVTSAGTQVALASSTKVSSLVMKAMETNTGLIFLGDSTVSSSTGGLTASQAISWESDNNRGLLDLADIYVDSAVSGEGVDIWYVEAA